ncbi:sodium/proton antiporter (NhaA family) [Pontibacter ummariensis]|uniref:Na(+)/H(+) antiporter NhaA n=1 Tax=Pontibacter ummariensis TaxID=1610492 RepID=A0A239JTK8_9BACT|nr:Na+/H+ antiporter NhaA [Pontibacter ummariensis]PRY07424.1 sodium/proton antiporter (NhaA family) [Pontibacter ummariensis]SNT09105.1 sodium/proton antiporter, NhaA family [Pontibacter ummariensis]
MLAKIPLVRRIVYPLQQFIQAESFSGILLMFVTVLALAWANSPWADTYAKTWNTPFTIALGEFGLTKAAILWINDGLMAIFFFVVGLEIKREVLMGELSSLKNAAFPVVAAIGGMAVPALIYVLFNYNTAGISGWGIPMATDIAFALGILTLLGNRVPLSLKLFLVAFAIVDDIGAVLVIALFYTAEVNFTFLIGALVVFAFLMIMSGLRVHSIWLYILLGILMWVLFLKSGVHATIAGILLAATIPARSKITEAEFVSSTNDLLTDLEALYTPAPGQVAAADDMEEEQYQAAVYTIEDNCEEALSPLHRLEHSLHPWVAYAIMPIFALANAGIFIDASLTSGFSNSVSWGIVLGLVLGKPVGIILFTWLASVTGLVSKPPSFRWMQVVGAGLLGGIGFTMSIFIANLAFAGSPFLAQAKLAILSASFVAGITAYLLLRSTSTETAEES